MAISVPPGSFEVRRAVEFGIVIMISVFSGKRMATMPR